MYVAVLCRFFCCIFQLHHHIHILVQSWPPEICSTQHFHSCCTWVIPVELLQHLCLQYLWNNMNDELRLSYIFLSLTVVDCDNLTDPANGQVNYSAGTTFRQTATYSCNTGYATTWLETVFALVKLQETGLEVHLPVQVFRHIHKKHANTCMYLSLAYLVEVKLLYGRV